MGGNCSKNTENPNDKSTKITSECDKVIWVKVDVERARVVMEKYGAGAGAEVEAGGVAVNVNFNKDRETHFNWNEITAGFSQIKPGAYLNFDVDLGQKNIVYVSVVTESGEVLLDACPKRAGKDLVVTNTYICRTEFEVDNSRRRKRRQWNPESDT